MHRYVALTHPLACSPPHDLLSNLAAHRYVAHYGEPLNIPDAYEDERFDPKYDKKLGYRTKTVLCLPILNERGTSVRPSIGTLRQWAFLEMFHILFIGKIGAWFP